MNQSFAAWAGACLLAILACGAAPAAERVVTVAQGASEFPGFRRSGLRRKADAGLARALAEYEAHTAARRSVPFRPRSRLVRVVDNAILVDARATADGAALLADLNRLGLSRGTRYGAIVSGLLPLAKVDAALALDSLRSLTASPRPIQHAGSITSQGDAALRADLARSTYAVDGSGVTVGVVSDSFDAQGGAATDFQTGDLPATGVTVLNGESVLCGTLIFCVDEGRAMLQIIHDVAPGADLVFHTGIDGIAAYASAIDALVNAGADVIVDDLLIINEPMFQDGIVAQAVDAAVAAGVSYFAAAGNSGRNGMELSFDDSGEELCIEFFEPEGDCDPLFELVGTMHDFDPGPGVDNYLGITVPLNSRVTIAMQWDQPYGGTGPETDHDIVLLDATGETYYTIAANDNLVLGEGWEALQFDNSEFISQETEFGVAITYDGVDSAGPPAALLRLVIFGDDVTVNEYATSSGTVYGHANAAGAEAVGAAFFRDTPENGVTPPILQPYSSAGGVPILFDVDGNRLAQPVLRQKPGIVGVDGVNTTFFFDDSDGDDGIDDFFGTSAAAPHAAGVAALLLQAVPGAAPGDLVAALRTSAIDMGASGVDADSGYGLIRADMALAALLDPAPVDTDGDGVPDDDDAFPNDPTEWSDSDGDGVGDNGDAFPNDPTETADSDGDGVGDNADAFPNDPTETADSDGDGVGDNADAFPNDPTETADSDGDGVGDNADAFPNDPNETTDTDGDGVGDNADAFPNDPDETADSDGDGVGDNADAFPNDPDETADSDGDGVGDNGDAFPADPTEWLDTDGDGTGNNADTDDDGDAVADTDDNCPLTVNPLQLDTDADALGDACDDDDDNDGVPDAADAFPLGQFSDVTPTYWAFPYVEALARAGITGGCGLGNFCPDALVSRAQMAVFLERSMRGSSYVPPPATGNVFLDVGASDFAAAYIEQLYQDGITGGCGNSNYCPDATVTRDAMAVFLLRARYGRDYTPPAPSGTFTDVDPGYWAAAWIEQLAAEGITGGCGGGNYCPQAPVTRAQMAVFLVRTFEL